MEHNYIEIDIDLLLSNSLRLWWQARSDFPLQGETDPSHRRYNRRQVEAFRKELTSALRQNNSTELENKIMNLIRALEANIIGYHQSCIDFFSEWGYPEVTEAFIKEARSFDSDIDLNDIFQAIRNVWIMNSMQILWGNKAALSPAIFSYSMLYPYSDNYLDDIAVPLEQKHQFNQRLGAWLQGQTPEPACRLEVKILQLVRRIEGQYPRHTYPGVHEGLLAIHRAQEKSLKQQRGKTIPYESNILDTTLEKGGTSVLADGYLVKGSLTEEEAKFFFNYGVFLQLIDDLQDVMTDQKQGHMTLFSQVAGAFPLDHLVNKLFWFIEEALGASNLFTSQAALRLKEIMKESCKMMVLEAISHNQGLFTKDYLKRLEACSILPLSYWQKIKSKFQQSFSAEELQRIVAALESS